MKRSLVLVSTSFAVGALHAAAPASLTIYNQNFAVVRQSVPLALTSGINRLSVSDTTAHLEPDSVILRDPRGKWGLRVLEQNFRADPISEALLLSRYEGQTIDFETPTSAGTNRVVRGKIVRSGYVPHTAAWQQYGSAYVQRQSSLAYGGGEGGGQPVIEVDGQVRFGLPGQPRFPALTDDSVLKPTLEWVLESAQAGPLEAELSYVTGGMSWAADYNITAAEQGDLMDLMGWVTIDNQSGRTFEQVPIKLMAGDVSKLRGPGAPEADSARLMGAAYAMAGSKPVTEKTFDEYHLYTLTRPTTLRDRQTKQVEFIRATGIASRRLYVYDGAYIDPNRYRGWDAANIRQNPEYGTESNPRVWVMRQFMNTEENRLGMPLPKGRVRFYRRDADGPLEFTGENLIDHTPRGEKVRVYTGNAFDVVGERTRKEFKIDHGRSMADESFEIRLRNRKAEPVAVTVVEHLYRWVTWELTAKSNTFLKTDSQTIEFQLQLKPDEEQVLTYTVHYTW
jgi:hypothetical protein